MGMTEGGGTGGEGRAAGRGREKAVAATLILCAAIVAFWQVMSNRTRRPLQPFMLTAADFGGFSLPSGAWTAESRPVSSSSIEPNILSFELRSVSPPSARPVFVRLVHGYNMPDCMRFKYYRVELLADTREQEESAGGPSASPPGGVSSLLPAGRQLQLWRLTSDIGETSIWLTSMIRVGDFGETGVDTRAMAFPRIGTPDPPGWLPEGMTWRGLRHPVASVRLMVRKRWNNAHCDLLAFLRLRKAAWASDDLLTLVAASGGGVAPADEADVIRQVVAAHGYVWARLRAWRAGASGGGTGR
jgi:hypothetical protein